jgi:DNA polymerase III delta prime subunit
MRNKLLFGADGPRMLQDALLEAREVLGTDNLSTHPDYVFVEAAGKKTIGVEEILRVVDKGLDRPVLAQTAVAVIKDFDALTIPAQNKLLLTLEANKNVLVIGIATRLDVILDTVKSRLQVVEYRKARKEEFGEFKDPALAYAAFGGDLVLAKNKKSAWEDLLMQVSSDCRGDARNLLKTLHLLEEKDPSAVTSDRVLVGCVTQAMKYAFAEKGAELAKAGDAQGAIIACECVARLDEEEALMRRTSYAKEDFFLAVADVINKMKGGCADGTL